MAELSDTQPLFPGNDEIDQLHQILSNFGSLPTPLVHTLEKNMLLKEFLIPKKSKNDILFKYKQKLSERGVNLLRKMLEVDP